MMSQTSATRPKRRNISRNASLMPAKAPRPSSVIALTAKMNTTLSTIATGSRSSARTTPIPMAAATAPWFPAAADE